MSDKVEMWHAYGAAVGESNLIWAINKRCARIGFMFGRKEGRPGVIRVRKAWNKKRG